MNRAILLALTLATLGLGAFFLRKDAGGGKTGGTAGGSEQGSRSGRASNSTPGHEGSQPSKSTHWPTSPDLAASAPAFSPLLAENPELAKVIMKHTNILNGFQKPVIPTLLDLGVPKESVKEIAQVLSESVRDLAEQLNAKNQELEALKVGSKVTVHGLTAIEHQEVVQALEGKLAGWVASDLGAYVAKAFARSTHEFTNRWDLEVVKPPPEVIYTFNSIGRRTNVTVTDLAGNQTETNHPGDILNFLEYAPIKNPPLPAPLIMRE